MLPVGTVGSVLTVPFQPRPQLPQQHVAERNGLDDAGEGGPGEQPPDDFVEAVDQQVERGAAVVVFLDTLGQEKGIMPRSLEKEDNEHEVS